MDEVRFLFGYRHCLWSSSDLVNFICGGRRDYMAKDIKRIRISPVYIPETADLRLIDPFRIGILRFNAVKLRKVYC